MKSTLLNLVSVVILMVVGMFFLADAQSIGEPGRDNNQPNPMKNVYFGEQHVHTGNSPDAFALGGRSTWDDVYNYALGKPIKLSTTGKTIQKKTPYDFVGITDHSEYFGVMPRLLNMSDPLSKSDFAKKLQNPSGNMNDPNSAINIILGSILTSIPMEEYVTTNTLEEDWAKFVATANKYNDPGKFTAFISYEWTSIPNGRNMHRNVYFLQSELQLTQFHNPPVLGAM